MKYSFLLLLFLLAQFAAFSQSFTMRGFVQSAEDKSTFPGATVILAHVADTSTIQGTVTDVEGRFSIDGIASGKYLVKVQYIGYGDLIQAVTVDRDLDLGALSLGEQPTWLGEITVTESHAAGIQKGDTTQFNAAAFKTLQDASAQSLVEKMPGISMQDGALQAQGENVVQILVDGKPFFGTDVKAALQNLPAEVIESIQVYDKKSDKAELSGFDDGQREKTINIITKPNRRKGQFGKSSLGYGNRGRYLAGASINMFNEDRRITLTGLSNNVNALDYSADPNSQGESRAQDGIIHTNTVGVNFSDDWGKKMEISGSYLFNRMENDGRSNLIRNYLLTSDEQQVYNQSSINNRTNMDHHFNLRFDYNIDSTNRLLIRPNVSLKNDRENSYFFGRTLADGNPLNQTENNRQANNYDYDFNNRMFYSHRFQKKGRSFTAGLSTGYHTNQDEANRQAENYYYGEEEREEILDQYTALDRTGFHWDGNMSYTEPLGKLGQVELEYEIGNHSSDSDKITYDVIEEIDASEKILLPDTTLSNTFASEYLSQEVELGYQFRAKKLRLQVEAEYRNARLKNDQEFPQPFSLERSFGVLAPTVRFGYEFSRSRRLDIDYDTRTSAPSINQLQDVIDVSNPLHLRTGNPDLDQNFSNSIRARYRSRNPETQRSFFVFMQTSFSDNYIATNSIIADNPITLDEGIILEKGSQLSFPVNLSGYWDFRSYVNFGKPVKWIKSNVSVNGSINYSHRPGMINNEVNFVDNSNYRVGFSISSNISEKVDFNFSTRSSYNIVENSLRPSLNNNYFYQSTSLSYDWIVWDGLVYRLDLNHRLNTGLADDFDNSFMFLNMSLGTKFLKNDRGEISLNVYDLLQQNNNIRRNVSELYVEDVQSNVLQRYFMLSFTYNLRHFSRGTGMKDYEELHGSD